MEPLGPVVTSLLVSSLIVTVPAMTGLILAYINYKVAQIQRNQQQLLDHIHEVANGNLANTGQAGTLEIRSSYDRVDTH